MGLLHVWFDVHGLVCDLNEPCHELNIVELTGMSFWLRHVCLEFVFSNFLVTIINVVVARFL